MTNPASFVLIPIGIIRSAFTQRSDAPRQGPEGGIDVDLQVFPAFVEALEDVNEGDEIVVITWLHLADRTTLKVHPRSDPQNQLAGVFATRSPDRPNPLGLHRVSVRSREGSVLRVGPMEAIDQTPVVDIKPVVSWEGAI